MLAEDIAPAYAAAITSSCSGSDAAKVYRSALQTFTAIVSYTCVSLCNNGRETLIMDWQLPVYNKQLS